MLSSKSWLNHDRRRSVWMSKLEWWVSGHAKEGAQSKSEFLMFESKFE